MIRVNNAMWLRGLAGLLIWQCLGVACAAAATQIEFRIPSGATSESSRLYSRLIQQFQQTHPEIRVVLIPMVSWDQVTLDVRQISAQDSSAGLFVSEVSTTRELEMVGAIISFDEAIERQGQDIFGSLDAFRQQFLPQCLHGNSYGMHGELYGPPFMSSTPIAFYNLDLLQPLGYTESTLPETWDDLKTLLMAYKAQTGKIPFGFGGVWSDYLYEALVRQAGGALISDDYTQLTLTSPGAVEALNFWKDLQQRGLMVPTTNWKATINGFVYQRFPVIYYSSGGLTTAVQQADFRWKATVLPKNKQYGVALGGGNLYLSAYMTDAELRAALQFAQFLYTTEAQIRISEETGYFPVTRAAFDGIRSPHLNALKGQFLNDQVHGKLMTDEFITTRTILKEAIERAMFAGVDAREALQAAQRRIEAMQPERQP